MSSRRLISRLNTRCKRHRRRCAFISERHTNHVQVSLRDFPYYNE